MNKIKGSSSAVKMKYLLFVFAAAVLVSLPTRVYQLLALVDASNGFFKESDITVPVLYAIVVVFSLLFLVLSFISKEVPSPKLPTGKNPVLGIASFVITAGIGWDMFDTLGEIIPVNQGSAGIFISLLRNNLAQEGGAFTILKFVFAFFAIIYFIVFGISHLNGKASYKEFKLLALSPLCWSMTMLVTKLMNAISFIKVSELLFEIFMFVFVMLFLITFARISSGVFTEDSMWGIYGYGLTASLFAAIVTVPRIVILVVGLDAVEGYDFNFAHFALLVFIMAYVFASLGVGFKDGIKNRRTINEIDLPDEFEAIAKKDDLTVLFEDEEVVEEIVEEIKDVAVFEEIEEIETTADIEETEEVVVGIAEEIKKDEAIEEIEVIEIVADIEEETEEVVVETAEEIEEVAAVEEIEIVTDIEEEIADTVKDFEIYFDEDASNMEETVEEIVKEVEVVEGKASDDFGIISLAELKKRKNNQ